jgi:Asp-tRNA(Asn)/Glu-tRNA(Gln) amidotransferase A subunit family amidase
MVSAATGTDTGGSIRIPAACCGVVGLKPTYGRVSRSGVVPFAWGLDHVGPMARRVRDVALLLTAMAGPDPYDRAAAHEPAADFSATLDGGVKGLRIALPAPGFLELALPPVAEAVRNAGGVLEAAGAQRVEIELPQELQLVGPAAIAIFLSEGGAVHRRTLAAHPRAYCKETRAFLSLHERVTAGHYLQAQRLRALLADAMARVFRDVDLLLTPTLAMTAPPIGARQVEGVGGPVDVRAAMTLFTRPFNLTGLPALSMPCGFHDGLPIGLQLVGRPFEEATVLRAAQAYESATEWHLRRPPLFA